MMLTIFSCAYSPSPFVHLLWTFSPFSTVVLEVILKHKLYAIKYTHSRYTSYCAAITTIQFYNISLYLEASFVGIPWQSCD